MSRTNHPGEFLRFLLFEEEMLVAIASERTGLTETQIGDLVAGRANINSEIAAKLAKLAGTKPEMWLQMQADFDAASK